MPNQPALVREGQRTAEVAAGGGEGDGGHLAAGELDEGAAEEVADAHAEGGEGKTGDVLVGPEGDGEDAVDAGPSAGSPAGS